MSAQQQTVPLVRTKDGAVLGVDQRRLQGLVPGRIGAQFVAPGDRIRLVEDFEVLVLTALTSPLGVHLVTQSDGGAEIVVERQRDEQVLVVSAGEFDEIGPRA